VYVQMKAARQAVSAVRTPQFKKESVNGCMHASIYANPRVDAVSLNSAICKWMHASIYATGGHTSGCPSILQSPL
jgi:hypothetical protein